MTALGTSLPAAASGMRVARPGPSAPTLAQRVFDPLSRLVDAGAARVRTRWPAQPLARSIDEAARTRTIVRDAPAALPGGRLPAGIHDIDLATFLLRFGTDPHRDQLLRPFAEDALRLQRAGVRELFVGGSVLDVRRRPGDVDALVRAVDADKLGTVARARAWVRGTHWHVAERHHATTDPIWDGQRPTWLEFFGRDRSGEEQAVARVLLG